MYTKNSDIEDTRKHASSASHDIYNDFENIQDKMKETRDAITETAKHVKARAEEIFGRSLDDVKAKSENLQGNFSEYVESNPLKAAGYAVLFGVALSYILRK